jgi:hypothetical protein
MVRNKQGKKYIHVQSPFHVKERHRNMNCSKEVRGLNEHITREESTIRTTFAGKSFRAADICGDKMLW